MAKRRSEVAGGLILNSSAGLLLAATGWKEEEELQEGVEELQDEYWIRNRDIGF